MFTQFTPSDMLAVGLCFGMYSMFLIRIVEHFAVIKTDSKTVNEVIDYRVKLRTKNQSK